jgi:hypothetical protein
MSATSQQNSNRELAAGFRFERATTSSTSGLRTVGERPSTPPTSRRWRSSGGSAGSGLQQVWSEAVATVVGIISGDSQSLATLLRTTEQL